MKRERQLIHTEHESVSVVGLVPLRQVVKKYMENESPPFGGIDATSGLTFVVKLQTDQDNDNSPTTTPTPTTTNPTSANLCVWRGEIRTLTEDLVDETTTDETPVGEFIHSDYSVETPIMTMMKHEPLVTLVPTSVWAQQSATSLYWCSPNGVINMWIDISNVTRRECDIIRHLPLNDDEYVTCTTYCEGNDSIGNAAGMILIGTSQNRTFKCVKITRPLSLHIQLLLSDDLMSNDDDDTANSQGLISSVYNTLFTPSKKKSMTNQVKKESTDPIVGLFPHYVSQRTQPPIPINKRIKIESAESSCLFTISHSGMIHQWKLERGESMPVARHIKSLDIGTSIQDRIETDDMLSKKFLSKLEVLSANMDTSSSSDTSIVVCVKVIFSSIEGSNHGNLGRIYLLHLPIDSENSSSFDLGSVFWLSRYYSKAIVSNDLNCAGMMVRNEFSGTNTSTTAFCTFQDMTRETSPTTVSAVRFYNDSSPVQCQDIDLPLETIPSILPGAVARDTTTDGCIMISRLGLVVNTRVEFPTLQISDMEGRASDIQDEQTIHLVKNHILSAFKQRSVHSSRVSGQGAFSPLGKNMDALPQSIQVCNDATLSTAVSLAAIHQANDNTDREGTRYSIVSSSKVIDNKISNHQAFVNFLIRTGIYRRVDRKSRVAIRDLGEKMLAIDTVMHEWKAELKTGLVDEDITLTRNIMNDVLVGIEENIDEFSIIFTSLCDNVFRSDGVNQTPTATSWALIKILRITCLALESALNYREEKSERLYDIRIEHYESDFCPWTSGSDVLDGLLQILSKLQDFEYEDVSVEPSWKEQMQEMVVYMSHRLLEGYYDTPSAIRDEGKYDESKRVSIPLVQDYLPAFLLDNEVRDEAYQLSVRHAFFDGVVEICHVNSKYGKFSSDYDLDAILSYGNKNMDNDNLYKELYSRLDGFQEFVFSWFTDKKMYGTVLQLGKQCPQKLSQYMLKDNRLSHLSWIQDVKLNDFENASRNLLKLYADGVPLSRGESSDGDPTTEENTLVLSFAKLAASASDNADDSINSIIDKNLEKCSAVQV